MNRSDLDETVRDLWFTRPHRRRDDRKIAGVAAAIARRYAIDPVLVRVAFVVTTIFGGIGIALYLLGWLLLAEEGDEVSGAEALFGQGRSSMSRPLTVVLGIALIPATSGLFTGHISSWLSLAAVAAGVYLLHRHRAGIQPADTGYAPFGVAGPAAAGGPAAGMAGGAPPSAWGAPGTAGAAPGAASGPAGAAPGPAGTASGPAGTAPGTTGTASGTGPAGADSAAPAGPGRATPPAWDPLGVAPFAWDLPDPSTASEPPARRRRSAVTPVTLALALMVGGATAIAAMTNSAVSAADVAAMTLAVVGLGLVVGSFVRGGRGLIGVAIPLALATYALSMTPVAHLGPQHGVGDRTWRASTSGDLQGLYQLSVGDATLDLRDLRLTGGQTVSTEVELGIGDLRVLLPPDADVQLDCRAGVGEVDCLGENRHGPDPALKGSDDGADGPGGGTIMLRASVGAGHVEVTR